MKIKKYLNYTCLLFVIHFFIINNLYAENSKFELEALKIFYKDNKKIIIADGDAHAKDQFGKNIFSNLIIYDKANSTIKTKSQSLYTDNSGNRLTADEFFYDINLKKISATNNVKFEDKEGNIYFFSKFDYFENSERGFGFDFKGNMKDHSSMESEYAEIDNKLGTILLNHKIKNQSLHSKIKNFFIDGNKYTTCKNLKNSKNIKEQCPDWSLSTLRTKRDANNKMITHDHAIIKIKNIPVFYTPYFSHPDPTVKRKSGFLSVSRKNFTDLGDTYKLPYFWAINESSDLTFTPIIYQNENSVFLTEYRKQNYNSKFFIDASYNQGYRNLDKKSLAGESLNRTDGSRNHFFFNYLEKNDKFLFKNTDIELNIQRISQKNYLNIHQINTEHVKQDMNSLENKLAINSYKDNKKLTINASIYENLNDENSNTKYSYKIPSVGYNDFFKIINQNISLSNSFEANNYNGDTKQIVQRNTLESNSDQIIFNKLGISNTIKFKTSNLNYYNENIENAKENLTNEMYATIGIENSLPMIRANIETEEILSPKIFTKHTTGSMRNSSGVNKILSYGDIYSMDRLSSLDYPETGSSIGYGIDYSINKKNEDKIKYLKSEFSIGQVLTDIEKKEMPSSSSLNKKRSNLAGQASFQLNNIVLKEDEENPEIKINIPDKMIDINYAFNLSNNIKKNLMNNIGVNLKYKENILSTNYYELNEIGNTKQLSGAYTRALSDKMNFKAGIVKNLALDYTESNFVEANYISDCLEFGVNLSKRFYQSDDLQKSNNLTIYITLKPFGQPFAPNLSSLLKD